MNKELAQMISTGVQAVFDEGLQIKDVSAHEVVTYILDCSLYTWMGRTIEQAILEGMDFADTKDLIQEVLSAMCSQNLKIIMEALEGIEDGMAEAIKQKRDDLSRH